MNGALFKKPGREKNTGSSDHPGTGQVNERIRGADRSGSDVSGSRGFIPSVPSEEKNQSGDCPGEGIDASGRHDHAAGDDRAGGKSRQKVLFPKKRA